MHWHGLALGGVRAGCLAQATVELENGGLAPWRSRGAEGVQLSYHWLDELGNPIVWDGERTALSETVAPGERRQLHLQVRGPMPPGRYRLAVDLVAEFRFWFADVGNTPLERLVDVGPRIARRLAARGGDPGALAAQQEALVPEAEAEAVAHLAATAAPGPDWSMRLLDAHQEGFAVVGGGVERPPGRLRRPNPELAPWAPGAGRQPRFPYALLCPSLVRDARGEWAEPVAGLPAFRPDQREPWLFDGRIVVRLVRGGR